MKPNLFETPMILLAIAIQLLPLTGHCAEGDTWVEKADMPTPRSRLASCVVDGKIYAMGGARGVSDSMTTVEVYAPDTDSWEAKADMSTSRAAFAAAAVNGKIYAIGGDSSWLASPMKIVEEYDPATDTWIRKADMPTARSGIAAAVVDGTIYVVGGLTRSGAPALRTVEAYDPATDTWEQKAAMTAPRGLTCAAAVDGKIFVIGSSQPPNGPWLSTAESYDPQTDAWTSIASITIARGALAGTTAHGRVYVMGGRDCCNAYQTLEEYDPVRNTWTTRASMESTSPINVAASEVNGRIYAIGGSTFSSQGSSLVLEYTPPVTTPVPPEIVWPTPDSIIYGTAITADQLNAQVDGEIDGTFSYTPALGAILEAGQHTLAVTFEPANGQPVSATAEFTVHQAPLTIRAEDAQRPAGVANPALTVLYLGFVNGDTEEDLDVPATVETAGTIDSPPGIYPIIVSAAADGNYAITFENGVLTVEAPVASELPELLLNRHAETLAFSWMEVAKTGLWRSVNLLEWTAVDGAVAENGVTRVTLTLDDLASLHGTQFFRLQRSE